MKPVQTLRDGGWVRVIEAHVPDHREAMRMLRRELPLKTERIRVFGREHDTPRLTSWHGDPGCSYRYSGRRFEPNPWTPRLGEIRDAVSELAALRFNSVLANYYRDGSDSMGAHSDNETELGPTPDDIRVASVSLGERRRFILQHRESGESHEWSLGAGDVLLMGGTLQRYYRHRVPKTKRTVGPRLNLTFRFVRT